MVYFSSKIFTFFLTSSLSLLRIPTSLLNLPSFSFVLRMFVIDHWSWHYSGYEKEGCLDDATLWSPLTFGDWHCWVVMVNSGPSTRLVQYQKPHLVFSEPSWWGCWETSLQSRFSTRPLLMRWGWDCSPSTPLQYFTGIEWLLSKNFLSERG